MIEFCGETLIQSLSANLLSNLAGHEFISIDWDLSRLTRVAVHFKLTMLQ
jgi:hypothetical protein